jgi:CRISPR/Cas system-associated protein Csm6
MKIITTVGTSIFTNYQNKNKVLRTYSDFRYKDINTIIEDLDNTTSASDYTNSRYLGNIMRVKQVISKLWIAKEKSCAELQTLYKIAEETEEELEVYLLATDTVLSVLACELIKEYLLTVKTIKNRKVSCVFNNDVNAADTSIVVGLQIKDAGEFENKGVDNLLTIVDKFIGNSVNSIFNISGGYKIVIPYLTLYAQIKKISLKYLYEDENKGSENESVLLSVPILPFSYDISAVYRYYLLLQDGKDFISNNHQKDDEIAALLIEECNKLGLLNGKKVSALGKLFKSYIMDFFAEGKSSLGFFMEYKLLQYFQYYDEESKKGRVLQSVEIEAMTEEDIKPKGNEIDIFIETDKFYVFDELIKEGKRGLRKPLKNSYIPIEVKPLGGINMKQYEAFLNRVNEFWSECLPKEVRIIVYSFLPKDYAIHKFKTDNRMTTYAMKVKNIIGAIPFRIQLVNIDIAFSKNDIRDELMKRHLNEKDFIGELLFINGELKNN